MSPLNIRKKNSEEFILEGDLTFSSINTNAVNSIAFQEAAEKVILDLSQVTKTDSAGLALLVEWKKAARNHHLQIQLKTPPEQILMLAKLNGIENMLEPKESK